MRKLISLTDLKNKAVTTTMEQQCFSSLKNQTKLLTTFTKSCEHHIKTETQKIENLLNSSENEFSEIATKKMVRYLQ